MNLHRLAEARSLALHHAVAARLRAEPAVLERARERVRLWLTSGSIHPEYASAWATLLEGKPGDVADAITRDDERMRALRQTTPFAGFVGPRERWAIWREVRRSLESAG